MTDPSAATPAAAASSTTSATGPTPARASARRDRPGPVPHRLPQRLRPGPLGQVEGAAVPAARPEPAAGRDRGRGAGLRSASTSCRSATRAYASTTQVLLGIFVAAQAPVLFSRDLRHGTISLYLARPLPSSAYARRALGVAAGRDAGLPARCPLVILYVGAAARRARRRRADPAGRHRARARGAARPRRSPGIAGLIASWSTRRGFAVVATIALLVIAQRHRHRRPGHLRARRASRGRRGRRPVLAVLALPRR